MKVITILDKCSRGFKRNGRLESSGIEFMYTLNDDITEEHFRQYTTNSILILIWLAKLFGKHLNVNSIESLLFSEDALFVAALILKLYRICHNNILDLPGDSSLIYDRGVPRGHCIVPIACLLNHSCDPNARNVITNSQKFILYAVTPIEKDSQVKTKTLLYYLKLVLMPVL